jgi:hypothetical protein
MVTVVQVYNSLRPNFLPKIPILQQKLGHDGITLRAIP